MKQNYLRDTRIRVPCSTSMVSRSVDLQFILDYQGEVHLYQNQVNSFLVAAAKLKISGLTNLATQQVGGQEETNIGEQQLGENPVKEETIRLEKETVKKRKRGRPRELQTDFGIIVNLQNTSGVN